jgi:hypothetical protein
VDADNLFVASYEIGNVYAVPLAGGAPVALDDIGDNNVAINSTTVFTVSGGGGDVPQGIVVGCAKTGCGGNYTTLASGQPEVWGVAADDSFVYWTNQGQPVGVYKAPVGGGPVVTLSTAGQANMIVTSNGRLFYAGTTQETGEAEALLSLSTDGGEPVVLVPPPSSSQSIATLTADCTNVYYATTDGTVGQVPMGGGTPTVLTADVKSFASAIAVDTKYVYFTDWGNGAVRAVPIGGGTVVTLASGQSAPEGIAVDGQYVYWSNRAGNDVMRVAK